MDKLPSRLYQYLISFCNKKSLLCMRRVCRRFRRLCIIRKLSKNTPSHILANFENIRYHYIFPAKGLYRIPPNIISAQIYYCKVKIAHRMDYLLAMGVTLIQHVGIDELCVDWCFGIRISRVRDLKIRACKDLIIQNGVKYINTNSPCIIPQSVFKLKLIGIRNDLSNYPNITHLILKSAPGRNDTLTYPLHLKILNIRLGHAPTATIPVSVEELHINFAADISHLVNLRVLYTTVIELLKLPPQEIEIFN